MVNFNGKPKEAYGICPRMQNTAYGKPNPAYEKPREAQLIEERNRSHCLG